MMMVASAHAAMSVCSVLVKRVSVLAHNEQDRGGVCGVGVRWVSSVAPICWLQCRCGLSTQNIGCFRQRALSLIFRGFGPFDGHVSAGEVALRLHSGNTQLSW